MTMMAEAALRMNSTSVLFWTTVMMMMIRQWEWTKTKRTFFSWTSFEVPVPPLIKLNLSQVPIDAVPSVESVMFGDACGEKTGRLWIVFEWTVLELCGHLINAAEASLSVTWLHPVCLALGILAPHWFAIHYFPWVTFNGQSCSLVSSALPSPFSY